MGIIINWANCCHHTTLGFLHTGICSSSGGTWNSRFTLNMYAELESRDLSDSEHGGQHYVDRGHPAGHTVAGMHCMLIIMIISGAWPDIFIKGYKIVCAQMHVQFFLAIRPTLQTLPKVGLLGMIEDG